MVAIKCKHIWGKLETGIDLLKIKVDRQIDAIKYEVAPEIIQLQLDCGII